MPTYDYMCQSCGYRFEKFQPITAGALRRCPQCGKHRLRRLIGAGAGVIFKGSGFYQTDYRSDAYRQAAKNDKPAAEPTGKSAGEKTGKSAAGGKDKSAKAKDAAD